MSRGGQLGRVAPSVAGGLAWLLALGWVAGCAEEDGWVGYGARADSADGGAAPRRRSLPEPRYVGSIGVPGDGCASLELRAEPTDRVADVVFVIDNSGSMTDEIDIVQQRMNDFSQQISDADVDVRIVLISQEQGMELPPGFALLGELGICIDAPLGSGSCPDDSRPPQYVHVPLTVGSFNSLEILLAQHAVWSAPLRSSAETAFVVVSDDDAWLVNAASPTHVASVFLEELEALDASLAQRLRFHGIFARTQCEQAANLGAAYEELVRRTGGVAGDLCRRDFQRVFDAVAQSVVAGATLGCAWDIPPPPEGEELLLGQVSVRYTPSDSGKPEFVPRVADADGCATADGWYYDDPEVPTQVAVCRTTCDRLRNDPDPVVDLLFGCDDAEQPD